MIALAVLAVVGGGLYGGYAWTQTQYYVGARGDHVAVYRGIDQKLVGLSLSKVHNDRNDIKLKYLPSYQQKQVQDTIAVSSLGQADDKADELAKQASVCQKVATAKTVADKAKSAAKNAENKVGGGAAATGPGAKPGTPQPGTKKPTPSATPTTAPTPSLSPDEKTLAQSCGTGQQ